MKIWKLNWQKLLMAVALSAVLAFPTIPVHAQEMQVQAEPGQEEAGVAYAERSRICRKRAVNVEGFQINEDGVLVKYSGNATDVVIPEGVTSIGDGAFEDSSNLTSVEIPETVTSIGENAFSDCSSLVSIKIPNGVTSIGSGAFGRCSSLVNISLPDGITSIERSTFTGCSALTSISIPRGVTSIEDRVFWDCSALTSINISEEVSDIGGRMDEALLFRGCNALLSISVAEGNNHYSSYNGVLYNKDRSSLLRCPNALTNISVSNEVTSIGRSAFSGCSALVSISLPNKVTSIGSLTFEDCSSLTSVSFPDGVTSIGDSVFRGCSSLTSINLPDGVTSIGSSTFKDCSSLTSIRLPNGVTKIGKWAFSGCSRLVNINLPNGITNIGDSTFKDCSSLTSIILPNGVTKIGEWAFSGCSAMTNISFSESLASIEDRAFSDCSALTSISLPKGIRNIGELFGGVFSGCSSLASINIPEGIGQIWDGTFENCSSLISINIPEGVTYIGDRAFKGCSKLTSVVLPESLRSIGEMKSESIFNGCSNLIIYGKEGSYAQEYAEDWDIHFRPLSLYGKIATITLTSSEAELKPGDTLLIEAVIAPADAENKQLKWSSSNTGVASVEKGLVTAIEEGNAVITAKSQDGSNVSASCKVEVTNNSKKKEYTITASAGIGGKISPEGIITAVEGESKTFTITAENGYTIQDVQVDGESVGAVFSYTITDITGDHTIAVSFQKVESIKIEKITLSQTEAALEIGQTVLLEAAITPDNAGNKQLKWSSSNPEVASVDNGLVTAIGEGSTTITAESQDGSNVSASCSITVQKSEPTPVEKENQSITGTSSYSKTYGDAPFQLDIVLEKGNGPLSYASSNPKAAEVSGTGEVKITGAGSTTVTVTASETEQFKKCEYQVSIKVAKAAQRISGKSSYSKAAGGGQFRLDAKRMSGNGSLSYLSANRTVATVSNSGMVTIKKPGNTVITVTAAATANYNACTFRIKLSVTAPKKGTTLTDSKTKARYKVTKQGKSVEYLKPKDKKVTKVSIPATVTISGVKYNVTAIASNALSGCKKLKAVTIGKNVESIGTKAFASCTALGKLTLPAKASKIGKQAFANCSKLKDITIQSTKLTAKSIGAKAFQGIHAKATIKVPKAKRAAYQKLLKSKGIGKKVKVK